MQRNKEAIDDRIETPHEVTETDRHSTETVVTPSGKSTVGRKESEKDTEEEYKRRESENESGEDSNEDEEERHRSEAELEEEKETKGSTETHHQSSTVKSDVGLECDDGSTRDSHGKCVGELN